MPANELISQIQTIVADYESALEDANKWRSLLSQFALMGYGPLITPEAIAEVMPDAGRVARIAGESQSPKRGGWKIQNRKPATRRNGPAGAPAEPVGEADA